MIDSHSLSYPGTGTTEHGFPSGFVFLSTSSYQNAELSAREIALPRYVFRTEYLQTYDAPRLCWCLTQCPTLLRSASMSCSYLPVLDDGHPFSSSSRCLEMARLPWHLEFPVSSVAVSP